MLPIQDKVLKKDQELLKEDNESEQNGIWYPLF